MSGGEVRAREGKAFPSVLGQLRAAAGFPSAYKFYHNNGGRRHFPFTYAYYARFERGAALPRAPWLPSILTAMRIAIGEEDHRRLMRAYLIDLLGGEEIFSFVAGSLASPARTVSAPLGREGLRWMKSHHSIHLSPEQFRLLSSDEVAYWCSEVLLNDGDTWDPTKLAEVLGFPLKGVEAAVAHLKSAGLVVAARGRGVRGRWSGKLYTFPGRLSGMGRDLSRIKEYWARMERRRGGVVAERVELVRAGAEGMRRYWRELGETVDAATAFGSHRSLPDSALFTVEARIRRLVPV